MAWTGDDECATWLDLRHGALERLAFLLAGGDVARARDAVRRAEGSLQHDWAGLGGAEEAERVAQTHLMTEVRRNWGRGPGPGPAWPPPEGDDPDEPSRTLARDLTRSLSGRQLAIGVLTWQAHLAPAEIAAGLGLSRAEVSAAQRILQERLVSAGSAETDAAASLDALAELMPVSRPDPVVPPRSGRPSTQVLLAAGAVLAAVTAVWALWPGDPPAAAPRPSPPAADKIPLGTPTLHDTTLPKLPQGDPPRVPWAIDNRVVPAEGGAPVSVLPAFDSVLAFAPYRDGYLVLGSQSRLGGPATELTFVLSDGQPVWTREGGRRLATSADGAQVAYMVYDDSARHALLTLADTDAKDPAPDLTQLIGPDFSVQAVSQSRVLFTSTSRNGVWLTDLLAPAQRQSGLLTAGDLGVVGGQLSIFGFDGHFGRLTTNGTAQWRWRNAFEGRLSPDGRLLATLSGDQDSIEILDAGTGGLVRRVRAPAATVVNDLRWEDGRHLLVLTLEGHVAALVRAGVDGSLERATPLLNGDLPVILPS